jgi:3'(2'), 5'-bisphosphate nucleotidase
VEETGAFDKAAPGAVTPMKVATPDNSALMVVASKSHRDAATDDYIGKYAVQGHEIGRLQPEILSGGDGRGRSLPPPWPHHGMGHRRRRRRVARGRWAMWCGLMTTPPGLWQAGWDNPFFIAYAPGVELKK